MLFTKDMSVGDLKNCLGQPRYTAVRDRMRAVVLRRQGKTFREIAKTLNRSLDFVKSWNDRFKQHGALGLATLKPRSIKPLLLSSERKEFLRERIRNGPRDSDHITVFTLPVIKDILEKELGVKCGLSTISTALRSMGFRKIKPRPIHPKNSKDTMDQWMNEDLPLF